MNATSRSAAVLAATLFFGAALLQPGRTTAAPVTRWEPREIVQSIKPGESRIVEATFTASEDLVGVTVNVVPEIRAVVDVSPTALASISKGETVALRLTISARVNAFPDALPARFLGTVHLLSGKKTISTPLPLDISVVWPEFVPADPGPEGKLTVEGIDSNANGVRDDVERWIIFTYPSSAKTRLALGRIAEVTRASLVVNSADTDATRSVDLALAKAIECVAYVRPDDFTTLVSETEAQMLNTKSRGLAYIAFSKAPLTPVEVTPSELQKTSCSFDPDLLGD